MLKLGRVIMQHHCMAVSFIGIVTRLPGVSVVLLKHHVLKTQLILGELLTVSHLS